MSDTPTKWEFKDNSFMSSETPTAGQDGTPVENLARQVNRLVDQIAAERKEFQWRRVKMNEEHRETIAERDALASQLAQAQGEAIGWKRQFEVKDTDWQVARNKYQALQTELTAARAECERLTNGRNSWREKWNEVCEENIRLRAENAELVSALSDLLICSECADETGYVTDVGFMDIDAIHEKARAALAKHQPNTTQNAPKS